MKKDSSEPNTRVHIRTVLRVLQLVFATGPYRVAVLIALTLATGIMPALQVLITAEAVQAAASGSLEASTVALWVGLFLSVFALLHLMGTAVEYIGQIVQLRLAFSISSKVMAKGAELELPDFERAEVYDLLQRAFQEASGSRVHQLFNQTITVIRQVATLVSVSAVIVTWNPWIALLLLLSTLPSALAQLKLGTALFTIEFDRTELRRRLLYFQSLTTHRQSVREIKVLGLSDLLIRRFRALMEKFLKQDSSVNRKYMSEYAAWGMLSVVVAAAAIGLALHDVSRTGDIGQLAGYFQAMTAIQVAAAGMFSAISDIVESGLFVGNLFQLLDIKPTQIDAPGAATSPTPLRTDKATVGPTVSVDSIHFTYPGASAEALTDVSFDIRAGETVAIVGPNGSGKSTILNLLLRLYRPNHGSIHIDDVDLDSITREAHLSRCRAMLQDFVKYQLSIRDNVGFGAHNAMADDNRVQDALRKADSHLAAPAGPSLDSQLGKLFSDGIDLSGGEWQRIALARSAFGSGDLVMLDEPASALDPLAEEALFDNLTSAFGSATKIFVSHRFSTVRRADRIIVLCDGSVEEVGTHDELMDRNGLYRDMFETQAVYYR